MAIVAPERMNFSNKNIIMILSGLPGRGKTTTALSAPGVLLIDADEGLARVKPEHRKDASICKTYAEVLEDIKAAKGNYQTIVIDTAGALIEMMKDHIIDHPNDYPNGAQKSGGISQRGYGYIKQEFLRLSNELRKDFNVIYIFHEEMTKIGETTFYSLLCEGSAKTCVYQPADLAAHIELVGDRRVMCFTPTENYTAKGAYGIKGLVDIPELTEGAPNTILTDLFKVIRKNLDEEAKATAEKDEKYEALKANAEDIIRSFKSPEEYPDMAKALKAVLDEAGNTTLREEMTALLKKRCKELGIKLLKDGTAKWSEGGGNA